MSERELVYGLLKEMADTAEPSLEDEFAALLLRVATEIPPQGPAEASLLCRASSFLLTITHTDLGTWRAIQGLLAAAVHVPSSLELIDRGIKEQPSEGFLRALGFEMKSLMALSPGLAARAGLAIVQAVGRTTGQTDLESFGHLFAEQLPTLLHKAPREAAQLALGLVDAELDSLSSRYKDDADIGPGSAFAFAGGEAAVDPAWWLQGTQQEPLQTIGALATAVFRTPEIAPLCCRTLPASFWMALAKQCSEEPVSGAERFPELLEATPLLSVPEIAVVLAHFLERSLSLLKPQQIGRIHNAVDCVKDDNVASALASLLPESVLSARLRRLRTEKPSAREDLGRMLAPPEVSFTPFDSDAWLRMNGAEPETPEDAPLLESSRALEQFASRYLNEAPDLDVAVRIVPAIHEALDLLQRQRSIHEAIQRRLADSATGAADAVLRCKEVPQDVARALWPIIVFAAEHPFPSAGIAGFSAGGWSRPAPRIVGATALMNFAARCGADDQVRKWILTLAKDPVEAVRYQVFVRSNALFYVAPDVMWILLELWVAREQAALQFLRGPLARVLRSNPSRAAKLLATLWNRDDLERTEEIRSEVAPLVGLLAEEFNEPDAKRVLDRIFLEAGARPRGVERILADMRMGSVWLSDDPVVRARYLGFLRRAISRARELLGSGTDSERNAGLALADDVISQSVFALEDANGNLRVTEEQAGRFLDELGSDLGELLGTEVEDYRAYIKAKLVCRWMQLRPPAGTIAARGFARASAVARRGGRSDELASALLSLGVHDLTTKESRQAAVELAAQLAPWSPTFSVALHEFAARVVRAG